MLDLVVGLKERGNELCIYPSKIEMKNADFQ